MAGRPSKSVKVLQMEGKSHKTKQELAMRERAEEAQISGVSIQEEDAVRSDIVAHKEFVRVTSLLRAIEKDDDMYGAEINLYCQLKAEIDRENTKKDHLEKHLRSLFAASAKTDDFEEKLAFEEKAIAVMKQIDKCDQKVDQKRRLRMDIEKNNLMNIAASLRSIPKTVEKKKNPLAEALGG